MLHTEDSGGSDTYMKHDGTIGTAGKGALIQTNVSATLGVTQDQYLFVPLYGEVAPLNASYYKGCGARAGVEREIIAVRRNELPKENRCIDGE